jgi:cation diffusion facilitator CzcD-associated flavoprotein CzcO
MTEHAVVIVGGGPAGLMLAGELALAASTLPSLSRTPTRISPARARAACSAWRPNPLPGWRLHDNFNVEFPRRCRASREERTSRSIEKPCPPAADQRRPLADRFSGRPQRTPAIATLGDERGNLASEPRIEQ